MQLTTGHRMAGMITLCAALVVALGMGAQYVLTKKDLMDRQTALVRADLDALAAIYDQRRIISVRQAVDFRLALSPGEAPIALWDRTGAPLAGKIATWPPFVLTIPAEGETGPVARVEHQGQRYLAAARMLQGGFPLVVTRPLAPVEAALSRLRVIIQACLAAVLTLGAALGLLISRSILTRINRFNALADRVGSGDLSARIDTPATRDEFGTLQDNIHQMLDRIESLHKATRTLSESIAHEMRTPLARVQARVSDLDVDPGELEAVHAEIRATIRIFDAMLEIARAQAASGAARDLEPLDLSALLNQIFDLYQPVAEEAGIAFRADIQPDVSVKGDRNLIAQLASNLVENALKFTPPGERLALSLTTRAGRPVLSVADTGPGIPPGFEHRIFDSFARAAGSEEHQGFGLGLALVQAIALRHGAKVTLPPVDKGFAIEVIWPKLTPN